MYEATALFNHGMSVLQHHPLIVTVRRLEDYCLINVNIHISFITLS